MAEIIQNFPLDGKLPPEVKFQIVNNLFDFLSTISKIDISQKLIMALGFAFSGITVFALAGKEFILTQLSELCENTNNLKKINFSDLEKCYFYLISNSGSGQLEIFNSNEKVESETNKKDQRIIDLINFLSKIVNSNDWSSQVENPLFKTINKIDEKEKVMLSDESYNNNLNQINSNYNQINFEIPNFNQVGEVKSEKLVFELGPALLGFKKDMIQKIKTKGGQINDSIISSIYDFSLNEKRLAEIILYISNNYSYNEEKDQRYLLKLFLKNINNELSQQVEENVEKKINLTWNLDAFYKKNKSTLENLKISAIFDNFDSPSFNIKDKKSLDNFLLILSSLKIENHLLQKLFFSGAWKNINNQLSFISFLLGNQNEFIQPLLKNKIVKNESLNYDHTNIKNTAINNYLKTVWSSLNIYESLLKIAQGEHMSKVYNLFEWVITNIPENIILALFQCQKDSFLHEELLREIFPLFLSSHMNSQEVLEDLWNSNQELFIEYISLLHRKIPETVNLNKILDLTQKIKDSLIPMVSSNNDYFSIWLATLAIKRDFLHIDQWISERIEKRGDKFIIPLLDFINKNVIEEYKKKVNQDSINSNQQNQSSINKGFIKQNKTIQDKNAINFSQIKEQILEKSQLTIEAIAIIFEHLSFNSIQNNPYVSTSTLNEVNLVYKLIFEIFDELHSHSVTSAETEEKANLLFRKLFNNEISVSMLTEQMKGFKESSNKKDNEVFACMLHSMLDEYRFFNKYPDKELNLMGSLFGKIIDLRLIDGFIESIALKYIIDGFKKQQGKLMIFSTMAVEQFLEKLFIWPQFLEELYKTTKNFQGELYTKITDKYNEYMKVSENLGVNHNPIAGASSTNYNLNNNPNTANTQNNIQNKMMNMQNIGFMGMIPPTNIPKSQIKNNKFNAPSDVLMNNIKMNNNSMYPGFNANNTTNSSMTPSIQSQSYPLTEKPQLNVNQLPFNPQNLQNRQVNIGKELNYSTNIKLVIKVYSSDVKFKENASKQIEALKNLAVSLSQFTILKNKPLLAKDLNLKEMLIEAYDTGKLYIATSFVCKFLEQTQKSKIFHNSNPWVVSIIIVLIEIHSLPDIAPQIKNQIEETFKILDTSLSKFKSKNYFANKSPPFNSEDFIKKNDKSTLSKNIFINQSGLANQNYNESNSIGNISGDINSSSGFKLNSHFSSNLNPEYSSQHQESTLNKKQFEITLDEINVLFKNNNLENVVQELAEQIKIQINSKDIEKQIKFTNDVNPNLFSKDNLCKLLSTALLNAINQILFLVVERTVNISLTTTRELTMKDFAFDSDPAKFKKAILLSVKNLSGSLANVTCKDPLRQGVIYQIKELFNKSKLEAIFDLVKVHPSLSKIIEVGCQFIKEFVIRKAIEKIDKDEVLNEEIKKRENGEFAKHLQLIETNPKDATPTQQKILSLPSILRPNTTNSIVPDPIQIYEEFDKLKLHSKE